MSYSRRSRAQPDGPNRHPRRDIQYRVGEFHDDVSAAYYDGVAFSRWGHDFGVLDAATFRDFEAVVTDLTVLLTHESNAALPPPDRIPESQYRYRYTVDHDAGSVGAIRFDAVDHAESRLDAFATEYGIGPQLDIDNPRVGQIAVGPPFP